MNECLCKLTILASPQCKAAIQPLRIQLTACIRGYPSEQISGVSNQLWKYE